jgi:hypothetical protein
VKRNAAALHATETTLDILRTVGFDPRHASAIARSALWTGITLVMSEPGYHPMLPWPPSTRGWSSARRR